MAQFGSGVRLTVRTAARRLRLEVGVDRVVMAHLDAPVAAAEFLAEVDGELVARGVATPTGIVREVKHAPWAREPAPPVAVELAIGGDGRAREVVVWFPVDAGVVLYRIHADAPVEPVPAAPARWVHHGSSISHGGNAADARSTWPAQVGRALGVPWTNLGFGGQAMLDPMTARSLVATGAEVVTLELGINVVAADLMRPRAFGSAAHAFLDTIRDGLPDARITVISAIACPALEDVPGPMRVGQDGRPVGTPRDDPDALTLARSRELLAEVVAIRDDPRLSYVDGLRLLDVDEAHLLEDGLHPGQEGLDLIARRVLELGIAAPSPPPLPPPPPRRANSSV